VHKLKSQTKITKIRIKKILLKNYQKLKCKKCGVGAIFFGKHGFNLVTTKKRIFLPKIIKIYATKFYPFYQKALNFYAIHRDT